MLVATQSKVLAHSDELASLRADRHHARTSPWLAWVVAVAVVVRVVAALGLGDHIAELPGIQDQVSYDALARQVLGGHGFTFQIDWWPVTRAGEPTAHWSFLYTLYLSAVYSVFGGHPLAARLVQAVVAG